MSVIHAVHIVTAVLDALQYAHTLTRPDGTPLRIVHRDVSPPNILLDDQGRVRLHDFGVARMANEAGEYKTQDGGFRGTLSYAAPETLQGSPASPQSDLYSCGIVLYQLLSGSNPIKGQESNETLFRVLHHVPPPVRSLRDDVPEAISDAIDRAISKDPSDRFESASAFAEALRAGSTWEDDPAASDFASVIERDFAGEMAARARARIARCSRRRVARIAEGVDDSTHVPRFFPAAVELGAATHSVQRLAGRAWAGRHHDVGSQLRCPAHRRAEAGKP